MDRSATAPQTGVRMDDAAGRISIGHSRAGGISGAEQGLPVCCRAWLAEQAHLGRAHGADVLAGPRPGSSGPLR